LKIFFVEDIALSIAYLHERAHGTTRSIFIGAYFHKTVPSSKTDNHGIKWALLETRHDLSHLFADCRLRLSPTVGGTSPTKYLPTIYIADFL